jgi:small GTP-binding protein
LKFLKKLLVFVGASLCSVCAGFSVSGAPFKVVLLGDTCVGKTCIMNRAVHGNFPTEVLATIGTDFSILTINGVKLQVWDTAGMERFRSIVSTYTRDADVAVVVFGCDKLDSVKNLPCWLRFVTEHCPPNCHVVVVGNKFDLINRDYDNDNLKDLQDTEYFAVSAKTGEGIQELFTRIVNEVSDSIPAHGHDFSEFEEELEEEPKPKCSC